MEYIKQKGNTLPSLKTANDDGEITTTGTVFGDEYESQLNEILREKDHIIELLTKEKNYYVKKTELLAKQVTT